MRCFLFGVIATICFASCFSEKIDKANNGKFCPRCKSDSAALDSLLESDWNDVFCFHDSEDSLAYNNNLKK